MYMNALLSPKCLVLALVAMTAVVTRASAQDTLAPAMKLVVDETQAARRIAFVHEEIPVRPGSVALLYPRRIPGEHGPAGPIEQFAALRVRSGKAALPWTRDPEDIYTIHVEVPADTVRITVDFDTLLQNTISDYQLLEAWNTVVLYPRGIDKRQLMIEPSILLPPNWKQSSSLRVTSQMGGHVSFAPVSLERLIDSPVLAGEFLRVVPLASAWPAELDITGDSQSAVDKADDAHAFAMFGKLRDYFAWTAADFTRQPARASTALVDTATEDWVLRTVDDAWSSPGLLSRRCSHLVAGRHYNPRTIAGPTFARRFPAQLFWTARHRADRCSIYPRGRRSVTIGNMPV
jgi:hypothetical protein